MNANSTTAWSLADFCLAVEPQLKEHSLGGLAEVVYGCVCRTHFTAPGFCLLDLGSGASSESLRRTMILLKRQMQEIHRNRTGRELVLLSAARFDQQVTTKPHRDGGPDECFLMLGYEPSGVASELVISDYSLCAHDMGITPADFLAKHNPMFAAGERLLAPYTTRVGCFANRTYQILLVNNSIAPYSDTAPAWQGVLHTATIRNPDESQRRVINSLMLASASSGAVEPISEQEQEYFIRTMKVRRSGYDKPELADDA